MAEEVSVRTSKLVKGKKNGVTHTWEISVTAGKSSSGKSSAIQKVMIMLPPSFGKRKFGKVFSLFFVRHYLH